MATEDEIQNALIAIHSRLGTIEGKVNLVARADRDRILAELEKTVRKDPLVGQIYLLLDGKRTQKQVQDALGGFGIKPSQPTVSRRMSDMATEHGIADLLTGGASKIYKKDSEMETVLNLSKNVKKWLEDEGERVTVNSSRRRSTR